MKIRIKVPLAGPVESYQIGDVVELPAGQAVRLIEKDIAEPLKLKEIEKAVKAGSEISVLKLKDLKQKGSYYYFPDGSFVQGKEEAQKLLEKLNEVGD